MLNTNGNFVSSNPLSQNVIPERYDIYKHSLSVHSIDIPILLKLRTKDEISKGIYFNFGTGLSYIVLANREIDRETGYDPATTPTNITSVTKGDITLKTQNNNSIGMQSNLPFLIGLLQKDCSRLSRDRLLSFSMTEEFEEEGKGNIEY